MKCDRARELLSDLHNGELDAAQDGKLQRHLQGCADCRAAARELDQTLELLATTPAPELPGGFRASLRQRLEEEAQAQPAPARPRPASPPAWIRVARAVGLVAAGAAAVLLILWPREAPRPPGPSECPARAPVATTRPAPRAPAQQLRVGQVAVLVMSIRAETSQPAAELQVVLPDGVALLGEGRRELKEKRVRWSARLVRGDNEIRIPVRARRAGTWRLVARAQAAGFQARSEARLVVTRS